MYAWEQRKLGRVAKIVGGGTPSTSTQEYWNGNIDWYSPVEIGEQIYVHSSQKKITELGLQKSSAKILPIGTILFTSRAGIGNTAILAAEGTTNQGFQSIVPFKDELDSYFIYSRSHELKRYGERYGAGSTFVEISGKQMTKMPMLIPTLTEQKKIGLFIKKLDNTLVLHQRKLDKLKLLKKGFMQVMFPQKGEYVPELRFANFDGEWEQRKLGKLLYVNSGRDYKHLKDGDIPVYGTGGYMLSVNESLSNDDAIGIGRKGTIDKPQLLKAPFWTVDTLFYMVPKNNDDLLFCFNLVNNIHWKKYDESTGVPSLSKVTIAGITVNKPMITEQKKIGIFIKKLDDTIALHQLKLDKLQSIKKAYLQKMFI